jgi:cysteine desulfurase
MKRIYMDHAATTPVRKEVLKEMMPYFAEKCGNASSLHIFGQEAAEAVKEARKTIAKAIGASPEEIVFTSGGTEADNLAIKGFALANRERGNHIVTSSIEHVAVINACKWLEERGFKVTYLPVDKDGLVSVADVRGAITDNTILISVMYANNEIGTIQPIRDIGRIAAEKGIPFHTDAVQAFGKLPINVKQLDVDMMSMSAHKIYGPKGVGALYVRKGMALDPLAHGGPQEGGRRAGTENVTGLVGFATAITLALKDMKKESRRLAKMRDKIIKQVLKAGEDDDRMRKVRVNGHFTKRLPDNVNFSFYGAEGEALVLRLNEKGISASTGSACSSHDLKPSHVLLALGIGHEMAHGSLRITLGRDNTDSEVNYIIKVLPGIVYELRAMSALERKTTRAAEREEEKRRERSIR